MRYKTLSLIAIVSLILLQVIGTNIYAQEKETFYCKMDHLGYFLSLDVSENAYCKDKLNPKNYSTPTPLSKREQNYKSCQITYQKLTTMIKNGQCVSSTDNEKYMKAITGL